MSFRAGKRSRRRTLAGFAGTGVPRTSAEGTKLYGLVLMLVMLVFFLMMFWGSSPRLWTRIFENQTREAEAAQKAPIDPALRAELLRERFGGAPVEQDREGFTESAAYRNLIAHVAKAPAPGEVEAVAEFDPVRAHADPEALRGQSVVLRGVVPLAAGLTEVKLATAVGDVKSVWRTFVTDFEGKNPAFVDLLEKPEGVTPRHAVAIDCIFFRLVAYETGGDRKAEVPWLVGKKAIVDRDADGADFFESEAYRKLLQRVQDHRPDDLAAVAVPFDREKALRDPASLRSAKVIVKGIVAGERGLNAIRLDEPLFSLQDVWRGVITGHQGDDIGEAAVIVDFVEKPPPMDHGRDVIEAECIFHRLVSYELMPGFEESQKSRRMVHSGEPEDAAGSRGASVPRRRLIPWLVARDLRVIPEEKHMPLGMSNTTILIFVGILLLLTLYGIVRVFLAHRTKPPRTPTRTVPPTPSPAAPPAPSGGLPPESTP